jgi:mRNA interferase MazF
MEKDFDNWNKRKKALNERGNAPFFHEREIWWCALGKNVGFEQDGKGKKFARPVLVFKKFNNQLFWALPLSTKIKANKFYAPVNLPDGLERAAILSQIRLIDAKRLLDKVDTLSTDNYRGIKKALIGLCGP